MTVQELIEKLRGCDPDAEVGHMISGVTGYVSRVSRVGSVEEDGVLAVVLDTDEHDGTLFPDEVGEPTWF